MTPYDTDDWLTLYHADVLAGLARLESESVQCVVTSPPYWGLRDYKQAGQIGLEPTVGEYLERMVTVFLEVGRVMKPDATLWLNLGDVYAASGRGGGGGSFQDKDVGKKVSGKNSRRQAAPGFKPKDLIGLPWRVAFALQAEGWYLRSDIIWHKPNPMPESVTDRPTRAHEYLFLLTRSERYYYDQAAIREKQTAESIARASRADHREKDGWSEAYFGKPPTGLKRQKGKLQGTPHNRHTLGENIPEAERRDKQRGHGRRHAGLNERWDAMPKPEQQAKGANKRDVWTVATVGFPGAHFATFPPKLVEPCILAGSKPGDTVLDPFCGTGTALQVALAHGRRAVGIDLSAEYLALAYDRCRQGVIPFLQE